MSHKRQNTHTRWLASAPKPATRRPPSVFLKLIAIIFYAGSYYSANSAWLETVETHDLHTQAGGHTHTRNDSLSVTVLHTCV